MSVDIDVQIKLRSLPLLSGQQISLVDQQQTSPFPLACAVLALRTFNILNIRFQVLAPKTEGISGIDNLDDQMRAFKDPP